jgi:hypothetical protein
MAFDYGWLVRTGCCARFRPRGHPLENLKLGTGFFYFRGCPGLIGAYLRRGQIHPLGVVPLATHISAVPTRRSADPWRAILTTKTAMVPRT